MYWPRHFADEKATRIADARSFLGTENTDFRALGAWPLYTDVTDAVELTRLDRVARQVREVYEKRFGLRPADAPSRVVVLYRDEESYRRFTQEFTDIGEIHGDGHADGAMGRPVPSPTPGRSIPRPFWLTS